MDSAQWPQRTIKKSFQAVSITGVLLQYLGFAQLQDSGKRSYSYAVCGRKVQSSFSSRGLKYCVLLSWWQGSNLHVKQPLLF